MRISNEELDELLCNYSANRIIGMHCNLKINLTGKQLTKVLKIKNGGVK
jgi:hypothetical protein